MKIGIEAQRLFRSKKHGMEVVALETLRELQLTDKVNKYEVFVADDTDRCLHSSENFNVRSLPAKFYPVWEQFLLPSEAARSGVQLLHCTANTAPLNYRGKLIVTIHDLIFLESFELNASPYQVFGNLYRRMIVPRVARKAKYIITVSEYSKKIIADKLNISSEKIRVIHNGVSPLFQKVDDRPALAAFRMNHNIPENYLLHFGNTAPRKNTKAVLQAYMHYRYQHKNPLKLVIAGCDLQVITELCRKHQLSELIPHLILPGYIKSSELPLLYNQATVFLYPSLNEGFGLPVIESMACGTPVITSNSSCLPEISGGAAMLVDPTDPSAIAAAIEKIMLPQAYNECIQKGFENAARFSWRSTAEKTLQLYKEATASP